MLFFPFFRLFEILFTLSSRLASRLLSTEFNGAHNRRSAPPPHPLLLLAPQRAPSSSLLRLAFLFHFFFLRGIRPREPEPLSSREGGGEGIFICVCVGGCACVVLAFIRALFPAPLCLLWISPIFHCFTLSRFPAHPLQPQNGRIRRSVLFFFLLSLFRAALNVHDLSHSCVDARIFRTRPTCTRKRHTSPACPSDGGVTSISSAVRSPTSSTRT